MASNSEILQLRQQLIGAHVKLWREFRKLTTEELAEQSGLDVQSVRDLEAGVIVDEVRRLDCVFRVAKAADVHPGKFLGAARLVVFGKDVEDSIAAFERSRGLVLIRAAQQPSPEGSGYMVFLSFLGAGGVDLGGGGEGATPESAARYALRAARWDAKQKGIGGLEP